MAKGQPLEEQASRRSYRRNNKSVLCWRSKEKDLDVKTGCIPVKPSVSLLDIGCSSSLSYLLIVHRTTSPTPTILSSAWRVKATQQRLGFKTIKSGQWNHFSWVQILALVINCIYLGKLLKDYASIFSPGVMKMIIATS